MELGCDIRFGHRLDGVQSENGQLTALTVQSGAERYTLPCRHLVLAVGHSARDTFELLYHSGVAMEPKPFAVGVRIEHRQEKIDEAQYGRHDPVLPPADYKLVCHLEN